MVMERSRCMGRRSRLQITYKKCCVWDGNEIFHLLFHSFIYFCINSYFEAVNYFNMSYGSESV